MSASEDSSATVAQLRTDGHRYQLGFNCRRG
jgi:hypothetical protein